MNFFQIHCTIGSSWRLFKHIAILLIRIWHDFAFLLTGGPVEVFPKSFDLLVSSLPSEAPESILSNVRLEVFLGNDVEVVLDRRDELFYEFLSGYVVCDRVLEWDS